MKDMIRKTIAASLLSAAVVGAALIVKTMNDKKNNTSEEDDDEINFINIQDEDAEDEDDDEQDFSEEVKEISALYPYLDDKFVLEQFKRNTVFNTEYPEDTLISINHKALFETPEVKAEFKQIAEENGYAVEDLGDKECIASKKMFTEEGSILSDIYNVANQVACLKGTYEGYRID